LKAAQLIFIIVTAVIDIEADLPLVYIGEVLEVIHFIEEMTRLFVSVESCEKILFGLAELREIINNDTPFLGIICHSRKKRKAVPYPYINKGLTFTHLGYPPVDERAYGKG